MTHLEGFAVPMDHQEAKNVPTKLDAWRRDNPNAFHTRKTKYGCMVQFGGFRIYYGKCASCDVLVHTRRYVADKNHPLGFTGSWPKYCEPCRARKQDEHNEGARHRMARHRKEQRKHRDEQFKKAGLPPVRQGVSAGLKEPEDDDFDWFDLD